MIIGELSILRVVWDGEELFKIKRGILRHALGLPNESGQSYRNRYVASPKDVSFGVCSQLLRAGLMTYWHPFEDRAGFFELTRAGAEAVLEDGETLCPEDFPEQA